MASNLKLKGLIITSWGSQCRFAEEIGDKELFVSQVIHGRRKLSREKAESWAEALKCDLSILKDSIKAESVANHG